MNTLLISYDLGGPETSTDYTKLINKIQSYGRRAKPLKSLFLIKTSKGVKTVAEELNPYIDNNDKLLVINVTRRPRRSIGLDPEIITWIEKYM